MGVRTFGTVVSLAAMIATTGCTTDPQTGQRKVSNAAIGGGAGLVGGFLLGDLLGGSHDRGAKIAGAGIGAIIGVGVGSYMDEQERKLRAQTAGTGVEVVREGNELVLRMPANVTFATNESGIQPHFQPTLDNVSKVLVAYPKTYIDVLGYTDSDGSEAYNQALSERRAGSVADYLVYHGVQSARIATKGFGEMRPIASNETPEGKAQNRRVEIKLVPVT